MRLLHLKISFCICTKYNYIIPMQYFFAFSISIFNIQLNVVRFVCGQTELINIPLL